MNNERTEILNNISKKDFDRNYFVELINNDKNIRDFIISELISNPNIMMYYHCYYVVSDASKKEPSLYYEYWDKFVALLEHNNSYHRNIGLTIIANLVHADGNNRLSIIWPRYITHIYDKKFMTGECCLCNIREILKIRLDMINEVVKILLNFNRKCHYTEKQIALMECNVLDIFDDVLFQCSYKDEVVNYIKKKTLSISPKTRKRAKKLINKYNL